MSIAKQIAGKSSIYAAGNILRGLAAFLMLPIYTRYLTPSDYGVIELISVVLDLTLLLLGARVAVGIYKFYTDAPTQQEKNGVISTALALMVGVHLAAVLLIAGLNKPIAAALDVSDDFGTALAVYSLSAVFSAANEVFYSYLRIQDRAVTYVLVNLGKLVVQLALNIVFIVYMDLSYWGVVWSAVLSSAALTVAFCVWMLPRIGFRPRMTWARQLVSFSAPIILASLAMYYIMFSSRYFLEHFFGADAVGLYALANKFALMIFAFVASPFSEYWSARQYEMANTEHAAKLFGNVFFYLTLLMLGASAGLLATVSDFLHVSATAAYWPALPVVPWLVVAYVLQAAGDFFRFGCFVTQNNRYIAHASAATVVVITLLYLYWIPAEGALGAGKAICVATLVRFAIIYFYGQRLFHIDVPWWRLGSCTAYFAALLVLVLQIPTTGLAGMFYKGGMVMVGCLAIFFTPLIEREHRQFVLRALRLDRQGTNVS